MHAKDAKLEAMKVQVTVKSFKLCMRKSGIESSEKYQRVLENAVVV